MYVNNKVEYIIGDILALDSIDFESIISKEKESITSSTIPKDIDYIFHCAANTKSADMINYPVETAEGIVIGTKNILNIAKQTGVKSIVYLSSMEVYGNVNESVERTSEDKLGEVGIFSLRSCYPLGKRMAEHLCYAYHKEYNIPIKIARLAQTFGIGVLPNESRVFFQFAKCGIDGSDIVLHTKGDSMGNYCDSMDAVEALITLLLNGNNGEAYNIVNETNTMTISEMAEVVANKVFNSKIKLMFDIQDSSTQGYAPKTNLRLSSEKIRNLGWKPRYNIQDMYIRMIKSLKG